MENRNEALVEKIMLDQGIDIKRNASSEVDFTVWSTPSVVNFHIEVEHKAAHSMAMAERDGMHFLAHKVDKYIDYDHKVFYVMVINDWTEYYVETMDKILLYGERINIDHLHDRKNLGDVYRVQLRDLKRRSLT